MRRTVLAVLVLALLSMSAQTAMAADRPGARVWPAPGWSSAQYMYGIEHTGFTAATWINAFDAPALKPRLLFGAGLGTKFGSIFAQPVLAKRTLYVGSWDGYEYALTRTGRVRWRTYLGRTVAHNQPSGCNPPIAGVSSTPTVVRMPMSGRERPRGAFHARRFREVLFINGSGPQNPSTGLGPVYFYALDAQTGAVLWRYQIGVSPQQFGWSSPVYFRGSVYFGVASFGDCPEVQGQVLRLDAETGALQARWDVVPSPCRAGAVWSSPTIDPRTGDVFVTTGNLPNTGSINNCPEAPMPYADAIVRLDGRNLRLLDHWQVPAGARVFDSDFGTTPTLFHDWHGRELIGASDKNGLYYAWDAYDLQRGPVWTRRVAVGGPCPQCGQAAIAPAAFDGRTLYVGGGSLTNPVCGGNVQALDPATGAVRWLHCFTESVSPPPAVLGAVSATPTAIVVGSARSIVVLSSASGRELYRFTAPQPGGSAPPAYFWGAPEVAGSHIYAGNMAGGVYDLTLPHKQSR